MVSLINFKIVNEELRENQLQRTRVTLAGAAEAQVQNGHVNQISVLNQSVAQHQQNEATNQQHQRTLDENRMQATDTSTLVLNGSQQQDSEAGKMKQHGDQYHTHSPAGAMQLSSLPMQVEQLSLASQKLTSSIVLHHHHHNQQLQLNQQPPAAPAQYGRQPSGDIQSGEPNFVVTWRNLRFAIEPKWHQRMVNASSAACMGGKTGAGGNKVQQAAAGSGPQNPVTKIVLDKLDGSFRSGELTAILGPSGAGKTTLLDCLTGHRKHGLSGSIKISSPNSASTFSASSSSSACSHATSKSYFSNHQQPSGDRLTHRRYPSLGGNAYKVDGAQRASIDQQTNIDKHLNLVAQHCCTKQHAPASQSAGTSVADNLKVSIIPQNDHLMGHLTVYETLNYASKMKNCFDKQFNHKLNIRRVAQQLGLMSCLGTRINKLSGGQYKRVSIAQELLSSPDILILDEPTSGLDAMTCYQTVQVLRKLTDDRQANGQNQIAVILTIHQPNSDVFQQFNHVYVVAQGGKCIYEGSPASIESVINRVGIRLPNSYYNPATMIVEIAAAKFGLEAIDKLNAIQKKQYESVAFAADSTRHEQNSTGDSAVDCRSSSSSNSNDDDDYDDDGSAADDDVEGNGNGNGVSGAGAGSGDRQPGRGGGEAGKAQDDNNNCKPLLTEINNNLELAAAMISEAARVGLVNKGFVMESEEEPAGNNGNSKDVIVVVPSHKLQLPSGDANSGDKIKAATKVSCGGEKQQQVVSSDHGGHCQDFGRKKRRRTRKRSAADQQPATGADRQQVVAAVGANGRSGGGGDDDGSGGGGGREKRLKLNSLKADQKFPFWRHTYLHFHRSWLSIVRDPMLCSMQLALHIIVPVMVSLVYGTNVGKPNACPRAGPMDIMAYALEPTDSALQLQEDLRTTLENIGYIFFKLYGIIFAAMTVTVLTFPLDMHVLVKEFRNGWYGLSSYFLGRTLADIPFQLTLPLLAMSLSYYATGQPYSYMQWRFLSITGILILSSLIAQSQGLLFGAILMDKMKAAVFVAPAATTPIILFAGFLVRTQSIPRYLRPLSNLSYLRYAIEACLISRYGFNQCECDPAIFNQTVPELPPIARSMLDYWLSSFKASANQDAHDGTSSATDAAILETTTQLASSSGNPDLFTKLIDSLAKANSFGRNITSCEQVVPYPMIDYDLKDSQLFNCFAILLFMLVFTRLLTFFIVCFKVKRKV